MPDDSPNGSNWSTIPDWQQDSRTMFCSTSGQPKRKGEPVYRGSLIDMEGFYDVCQDSALQLGRLAGLVAPEEAVQLAAIVVDLKDQLEAVQAQLNTANAAIEGYTAYQDYVEGELDSVQSDEDLEDLIG